MCQKLHACLSPTFTVSCRSVVAEYTHAQLSRVYDITHVITYTLILLSRGRPGDEATQLAHSSSPCALQSGRLWTGVSLLVYDCYMSDLLCIILTSTPFHVTSRSCKVPYHQAEVHGTSRKLLHVGAEGNTVPVPLETVLQARPRSSNILEG